MSDALVDGDVFDLDTDDLVDAGIPCPAMTMDIGVLSAPMPINILLASGSQPMPLSVCWPPVEVQYVTDNGVVVLDENGEPVYVVVGAGGV